MMAEVKYSIKDLENFTGIKAHTIRIWEQRYNLLKPKRTKTNIRFYDNTDLKKILNINLLYNSGHKISKIALLSELDIINNAKLIITERNLDEEPEVDALIIAILDFDKNKIKEIFNNYSSDIYKLYSHVIIPFLKKIGELWQVNTIEIVHEHLFSSLYRGFLISKIENLASTDHSESSVILFLHDDEQHEFSILLYYYLFKSKGYNCFYLGQNLPLNNLKLTISKIAPKYILTTCIAQVNENKFRSIIQSLVTHTKETEVIIGGYQTSIFKELIPSSIKVINSKKEFEKLALSL